MIVKKSILAATDKLELSSREEAVKTEHEVEASLDKKYSARALAESIKRERRAVEM